MHGYGLDLNIRISRQAAILIMGCCSCLGTETLRVIVLVLIVFAPLSTESEKAYACATTANHAYDNDCILFDFDCGKNKKILIRDILYVFGNEPDINVCKTKDNECQEESKDGCCTATVNPVLKSFGNSHKYEMYKRCSWSESCTGHRTPIGSNGTQDSEASLLKYECQPDGKTVHLCVHEDIEGTKGGPVNIILDDTKQIGNFPVQCECTVTSENNQTYTISAPDLRLRSSENNCNTKAVLSGLRQNDIVCDGEFTNMCKANRSSQSNITLSFQAKPEFIWIEAKAEGDDTITVQCFEPTDPVTSPTTTIQPNTYSSTPPILPSATTYSTVSVGTSSTTPPLTSTNLKSTTDIPSSSSGHQPSILPSTTRLTTTIISTTPTTTTTTSSSTTTTTTTTTTTASSSSAAATTTTTTTTDFNNSDPHPQAAPVMSSDDFPIAAVVIPVVLVAVAALAVFAWLKWRRRKSTSKPPVDDQANRPINAIQNKAYTDTDQIIPNDLMKTADNYIVLDQDSAYTYIDHVVAQEGIGQNIDNNAEDGQNHDYFVLDQENTNAAKEESDGKATVTNKNGALEGPNYFVLEPQNYMNATTASPKVNENLQTHKAAENEAQSHNYFVLEPQKPQTKTTTPQKTTGTVGLPGVGKVNNQNYEFAVEPQGNNQNYEFAVEPPENNQNYEFALEPQDTYSSIDPDDVVIQTLPENEYNVINTTGKATTSRGPNYGTLETLKQKANDIEDSGEYSHIGQDTNKNGYMKEKSTIDHNYGTLGTADKKGGGIEDSGDYSHIEKG